MKIYSKLKEITNKAVGDISKKQLSEKKIKVKKVLKPSKTTLVLKKHEPAPYVSRYFKDELSEAKRSMFFEWYSLWDFWGG